MRPSGAQMLTRLGLDCFAVQLLGRWGSNEVMRYVREAAASTAASEARAATVAKNLNEVLAEAKRADFARGDFTADQVRAWVAEWLPTELTRLKQDLAKELANKISLELDKVRGRGRTASPTSSSSSRTSSSASSFSPPPAERAAGIAAADVAQLPDTVSNRKGKLAHRILTGPPTLDPRRWITACGWRFGTSSWACTAVPEHARCRLCFPS